MIGQDKQMADSVGGSSPGAAVADTAMQCEYCQKPLTRGQEVLLVVMAQVWREEIDLMETMGAFCSVECLRRMQFEPTLQFRPAGCEAKAHLVDPSVHHS